MDKCIQKKKKQNKIYTPFATQRQRFKTAWEISYISDSCRRRVKMSLKKKKDII